jgi:hypothetical protein
MEPIAKTRHAPAVKGPKLSVEPSHGFVRKDGRTSLSTIEDRCAKSMFTNSSIRFHIACSEEVVCNCARVRRKSYQAMTEEEWGQCQVVASLQYFGEPERRQIKLV